MAAGRHGGLAVEPPLDRREVAFVNGAVRSWPGRPAPPCPWQPCDEGCCLVLGAGAAAPGAPGQWLRFLVDTFLAPRHRVLGVVPVDDNPGRPPTVLVAEGDEVFEGYAA
jgi:hypothetical protein